MKPFKRNQSKPLSILLIDDSAPERALLRIKLEKWGHHITEFSNGNDALKHLADNNLKEYELLLLDVNMPGLSGLETAQQIRQLEATLNGDWLPIIFLSGHSDPDDIALGIQAGGDDYLSKPVNTVILNAKIVAIQRIASLHQQLQHQSHTDELTQLTNRRHFLTILESEINRAKRQKNPLCIAYLDLDHFKNINDHYGHDAGDEVLRQVANAFTLQLRSEDCIGRLGGEEFAICLPGSNIQQSQDACERYRTLIESLTIRYGIHDIKITVSLGLTGYQAKYDDIHSLLKRADKALYQAKYEGRNCLYVIEQNDSQ